MRARRAGAVVATLITLALALTACGGAERSLANSTTPDRVVTSTPIVVNIQVVPPGAPSGAHATAEAAGTRIAATTAGQPDLSTPTPEAVDAPAAAETVDTSNAAGAVTITPEAVGRHAVRLTPLPTGASTGLTPTEAMSDTAVPPPVAPVLLPPGTVNVALLGVDMRPGKGFANTDVIIIASINPDVPSVTMLSIPRDTLVYIPGWRSHKVNTAFAHGGPELFKQTIKYNFGINVDSYAMVNFGAVVNTVNTLGGVDVVATCPLYQEFPRDPYYLADESSPMTVTVAYTDTFSGDVWQPGIAVPTETINIPYPGVYTLDGLEALAYARARYGVPGGDVDRGRRGQRLIRAILVKARQVNAIPKIPQLYERFRYSIQTDLSLENILYFAEMAGRFDEAVIRSRYLDATLLRSAMLPEVGAVLVPERDRMRDYVQQALYVALNQRPNEGIPVEVWNGTGNPDFGIVAADRLAEMGFIIAGVQQADKPYPETRVIDFTTTRKGSAVPLLQRTFNLKDDQIVAQPTKDGPRYRIIVGPDFNPCYYQEGGYEPVKP